MRQIRFAVIVRTVPAFAGGQAVAIQISDNRSTSIEITIEAPTTPNHQVWFREDGTLYAQYGFERFQKFIQAVTISSYCEFSLPHLILCYCLDHCIYPYYITVEPLLTDTPEERTPPL